jgi:hypothetical protein
MAKFLKIVSSDATQPEVLIGINQVDHVKPDPTDAASLASKIIVVSGAKLCTITYSGGTSTNGVPQAVLKAFNAALTANPGGIVSTVGSPLVSAQTFVGGAIDGRMVIDDAAVYVTYTDVAFA